PAERVPKRTVVEYASPALEAAGHQRLAVAMQRYPEERRAIQKSDLGHLEGGQQAFLADLAGEDVAAEIAEGDTERQSGIAGRAGLPRALARRGLVLVEIDLLL